MILVVQFELYDQLHDYEYREIIPAGPNFLLGWLMG